MSKNIRNFCIIAHIDHGKSTLADRILERTGTVTAREMEAQFLDNMDLERERGITIKAQSVRIKYKAKDGQDYILNLIDTPGHVDFTYEVSRSLAACEGAILVVDASQGVEAQTLANVFMALDSNLEVFPAVNKIDLPSADPERVLGEVEEMIGMVDTSRAVLCSAKAGIGIDEVLEAVVKYFPAPKDADQEPLRALIYDSWYDSYQGVVALCRVFEGTLAKGMKIRLHHAAKEFEILRLGVFSPKFTDVNAIPSGEVGAVVCGIRDIRDMKVGDTIMDVKYPATPALGGFKEAKPMVFSGVYPVNADDFNELKESLEKLRLNDSAMTYEPETSNALGFGFRCGFLGLLHMDVVQERLDREYNMNIITTAPSVVYRVLKTDGEQLLVDNPAKLPDQTKIERIEEPYIRLTVHMPAEYVGSVMALCNDRRGMQEKLDYVTKDRVALIYSMPLNEMVFDFYDRLKSATKGYASMDYELSEYRESELVKLDILLNNDPVDALSVIIHRSKAAMRGRELAKKLKELIQRQMFEVAIQAAIGTKVVARETVSAYRKNVTAKCYGGDISRKRKLLEKQKEGKKRMKQIGNVEVPQEAFLAVLKVD
ncbi:MAG TPA: elongation factor 4 [Bdellovibrionales bacterium]|nr:MAG: elongation factor 4 [Bdellovibrionales bacterium GWB1_52_6]OFZ05793.1 MAG: elongation factor 4 [Bdellovibrionales bacterium GWA1_52_35]OFZ43679.1 MAG: elongation factor 4 [Bdellovibrionales bacterium GWC1_52_8]HAR42207.1 elongation factor 4 [Bdellovibrionales bacterium]HCM40266.1 elongation factor 4 [Bdellovibrionales bacterium]